MPLAELPIPLSTLWGLILLVAEILGILSAFNVIMRSRTSQGAIAWVIALVAFPLVPLPFYWVFGRNHFHGYLETLHSAIREQEPLVTKARDALRAHHGYPTSPLDKPQQKRPIKNPMNNPG